MKYEIRTEGERSRVALTGDINESLLQSLKDLPAAIAGKSIVFDCSGVSQVNSIGVQQWTKFLTTILPSTSYSFDRCRSTMVSYASLVDAFLGKGAIESVFVPYECEHCGMTSHFERAVVLLKDGKGLEADVCGKCGHTASPPSGYVDEVSFLID